MIMIAKVVILSILASVVAYDALAMSEEDSCQDLHPVNRIECGWPGISQEQCESKGCCYDSRFPKSLWCFRKDENTQDNDLGEEEIQGSIVRSCVVNPSDRVDCGWPSIKKEVCENRGCCYSEEYRNSFWCFHPKAVFVQPVMENVLRCTAECANISWRKAVHLGITCQTSVSCWLTEQNIMSATCMSACKTNTSVSDFIQNVSECLELDEASHIQTSEQCEFDVDCWVEKHGQGAAKCFKEHSKYLSETTATVGEYGEVARHPNPAIEMPPVPPHQMMEPNASTESRAPDPNRISTDINIEKSYKPPVEDLTEEEEPNPWWERQVPRA